MNLKEETTKPELSITYNPNATDDYKDELTFDALIDVEGVNALKENQRIELTPNLTILYGVISYRRLEIVNYLIEKSADINHQDN